MLIEALFTAVMSTVPTATLATPVAPAPDVLCDEHGKKGEKSEGDDKDEKKDQPKPQEPKPS